MNYYDELGVSPSASTDEIQHAYRALVRILHPDQQQEETLRHLSDLQLRRLNQIVSVLTDPGKRRAYDFSLTPPKALSPARQRASAGDLVALYQPEFRFGSKMLVWLVILGILIASGVFWFYSPAPVYSHQAPMRPDPAPTAPPVNASLTSPPAVVESVPAPELPASPPVVTRKQALKKFLPAHPAAEQSTLPLRTEPTPSLSAPPAAASLSVSTPAAPQKPKEAPIISVSPKPAVSPLIGRWLYVPRGEDNKSLYPPQYIEMQIQERTGTLQGKYYARYRVPDRAISPEMTFRFEGKVSDSGRSVSVLPWSSTFGSRGEIRLKQISEESLEVTWITIQFGRSDVLASGTAVLYRNDP